MGDVEALVKAVDKYLRDSLYGPERRKLLSRLIDDERLQRLLHAVDDLHIVDNIEDDLAIAFVRFVTAMAEKLIRKAQQGYNGWTAESSASLRQSIAAHLLKGDPVDVANISMFWFERQQAIKKNGPNPDDDLIQDVIAKLRAGGDIESAHRALDKRFTTLRNELRALRGRVAEG